MKITLSTSPFLSVHIVRPLHVGRSKKPKGTKTQGTKKRSLSSSGEDSSEKTPSKKNRRNTEPIKRQCKCMHAALILASITGHTRIPSKTEVGASRLVDMQETDTASNTGMLEVGHKIKLQC